jgi:hypothetical protein
MYKIFALDLFLDLSFQGIMNVDLPEHILLRFLIIYHHERSDCHDSRLRLV